MLIKRAQVQQYSKTSRQSWASKMEKASNNRHQQLTAQHTTNDTQQPGTYNNHIQHDTHNQQLKLDNLRRTTNNVQLLPPTNKTVKERHKYQGGKT
jgi:hypothetical protein